MSGGRVSTLSLLGRHLLTDGSAGAALAAIVITAAFLAGAVPRALESLATEGLRATIEQAPTLDRDLLSTSSGLPPLDYRPSAADPTAPFGRLLAEVEASLDGPLAQTSQGTIGSIRYRSLRAESAEPAFRYEAGTSRFNLTVLTDAFHGEVPVQGLGVGSRVRYLQGVPPTGFTFSPAPAPPVGDDPFAEPGGPAAGSTQVDAAVSVDAAEVHGLQVGSVVQLNHGLSARVTGVVQALDADEPYWQTDDTLLHPAESYADPFGVIHTSTLLVPPAAAAALDMQLRGVNLPQISIRTPLGAGALRAGQAPELVGVVRRLEDRRFAMPAPVGLDTRWFFGPNQPQVTLSTGFDTLLLDHLGQRRTSAAVVAVVSAGFIGVTLAVLVLATRLVVERRRRPLSLLVARGGSIGQVVAISAVEGLLLGAPPAALGLWLAHRLVPGDAGRLGWTLPVLVGLALVPLLPALAVSALRGGLSGLRGERRDTVSGVGPTATGRRRLVLEIMVLVIAAGAVLTLRSRGLVAPAPSRNGVVDPAALTPGADPLVAAAPLLLALAAAVLVARLAPLPLRWLAAVTGRGAGAVTFLGAARAGRDQVAGTLPVLVVVLAMSTCVVGVVVTGTSQHGVRTAAWQQVGADGRLTALGFTDEELTAAARVEGVAGLAAVSFSQADVASSTREGRVDLIAATAGELNRVQGVVPGAARLPTALDEVPGSGDRLPVVVSSSIGTVGEELTLERGNGRDRVEGVVVGTADRLVSLSSSKDWVLANPEALEAMGYDAPLPRLVLVDLAEETATTPGRAEAVEEGLRAALATGSPLLTRADAQERISEQPMVRGTLGSFAYVAVLAALMSALAVALTLVAAAAERVRLLSRLRTLGLDGQQSAALVAWEAAPVVVPGVLVGWLVGAAVVLAVYPALDLRSFTGGAERPSLAVDTVLLLGSTGGVLAASVVAVLAAVLTGSRARLGAVLRVGDET